MKHIAVLAIFGGLTLTVNAAVSQQGASNHAAVEKTIVANERAIITAIWSNDLKAFQSHVVPDSYMSGDTGPEKVTAIDKAMAQIKKECKVAKWDFADPSFYWVNESTVIYMYRIVSDATCSGQPLPAVWATSVFSKRGESWLGVFHQETPIAPPAAAPKK